MATNRKRRQSAMTPGTIFGIVMTLAGLAVLAYGFGFLDGITL